MRVAQARWFLIIIILSGTVFLWTKIFWLSASGLEVSFLAVGQGDAILIRAPGGRTVLVDGGPGRGVLEALSAELPFFVREIDLLIETHPDTDHAAGLPDVAGRFAVRGIIKPCINSDNPYDQALHRLAVEKKIKELCARPGQMIDLGGGSKIEILYAGEGERADTNEASVVALLTYGHTEFLLAGDTTIKVEKYLAYTQPEKLSAEVYKVSHHGSRESNNEEFLKLVKPEFAIISVGKNRYGHPHQETLDLLAKLKSAILRTDRLGTIVLSSDGQVVSLRHQESK